MLIDRCLFFCVCVFISASSNSGYPVPALILATTMPLLEESSVPRDCTRTVPVVIIGESSRSKHYQMNERRVFTASTNRDGS